MKSLDIDCSVARTIKSNIWHFSAFFEITPYLVFLLHDVGAVTQHREYCGMEIQSTLTL